MKITAFLQKLIKVVCFHNSSVRFVLIKGFAFFFFFFFFSSSAYFLFSSFPVGFPVPTFFPSNYELIILHSKITIMSHRCSSQEEIVKRALLNHIVDKHPRGHKVECPECERPSRRPVRSLSSQLGVANCSSISSSESDITGDGDRVF